MMHTTHTQMAHILGGESVATWKAQLRDRIMKNLDDMLQDAAEAYQQKIADNATAPTELLYQFQSKYNWDVRNLQAHAEEQLKIEIAREEKERKWASGTTWNEASDVTQSLVKEQLAILNGIKSASPRSEAYSTLERGSSRASTEPYPFSERSSSTVSTSTSFDGQYAKYEEYHTPLIQTVKVTTAADREARARAEKHERQQEEFRRRAQAILERKQKERQCPDDAPPSQDQPWSSPVETENMSSSSSTTSASDQEPAFGSDSALFKAENPMNEEDIANLVLFHLQQWTWILTLPHIQWADFPWPLLSFSSPRHVEDLTLEAVAEYVFAPLHVRVQNDSDVDHSDRVQVKDRLKELIRRWHPDRFEIKYLAHVEDLHEREMVREGAGIVARILNDLLGKWNDL